MYKIRKNHYLINRIIILFLNSQFENLGADMADKMQPINFKNLLNWIVKEYLLHKSVFGIPFNKFLKYDNPRGITMFSNYCDSPIGPAAGPHTQLAQNIIASYLTGGRFFELKTVQVLDNIKVEKPCIDADDECYNVEWSQELSLEESFDEYLKAWIILHLLKEIFGLSTSEEPGFIFNMSVGYDLAGIKTDKMDKFISSMINAEKNPKFFDYKKTAKEEFSIGSIYEFISANSGKDFAEVYADKVNKALNIISPNISNSVTLSTMHGCPPDEIESIAKYLISEKKLNTFIKLNPTLLGYKTVSEIFQRTGYGFIELKESSFSHDLKYDEAVELVKRMILFAEDYKVEFGLKLTNTLGVVNSKRILPGDEMYMSGKSLFPLTIKLAATLAGEFNGKINISYSGGANYHNIDKILNAGIYPVTVVTDLLKPGGYERLYGMAENFYTQSRSEKKTNIINIDNLQNIAEESTRERWYQKDNVYNKPVLIDERLSSFDCYAAPCKTACPIHQDVPEYMRLIEEKNYEEAFKSITSKNPLPHITGYICDHQCMYNCTRRDYDTSVSIRELKKAAAEIGYNEYRKKNKITTTQHANEPKAAVIGAGPAGLSAAYFLAKNNFNVTVLEKTGIAGGTVMHVIPNFRLPREVIEKDVEFIKMHGVNIVYNSGSNFSIEKLKAEGYKYIFIATGAQLSNPLDLETANNSVFDAIEFLTLYNQNSKINLGKNVAVIGGGNSAMDSARAAKQVDGVENVFIIYRRTKEFMPADLEEYEAALNDGVIFKELLSPYSYKNNTLLCSKMKYTDRGADGRRNVAAVENQFEEFKIDSIIAAIGEHVDMKPLKENGIVFTKVTKPKTGLYETSIENVFIGGDALRGPATVVEAIADGQAVAKEIVKKEKIEKINLPGNRIEKYTWRFNKIKAKHGKLYDCSFNQAETESARCLECDLLCNKCVEVCPNRANIAVELKDNENYFKDKYQIVHIDGLCNECGNCETFCPYEGAPYRLKPTLFRNEKEFNKSKNDGFYIKKQSSYFAPEKIIKMRIDSFESEMYFNSENQLVSKPLIDKNKHADKLLYIIQTILKHHDYLL